MTAASSPLLARCRRQAWQERKDGSQAAHRNWCRQKRPGGQPPVLLPPVARFDLPSTSFFFSLLLGEAAVLLVVVAPAPAPAPAVAIALVVAIVGAIEGAPSSLPCPSLAPTLAPTSAPALKGQTRRVALLRCSQRKQTPRSMKAREKAPPQPLQGKRPRMLGSEATTAFAFIAAWPLEEASLEDGAPSAAAAALLPSPSPSPSPMS